MSSSISGRLEIILIVDMLLGVYRICVVHKFNLSGSGLSSSCLLLILHYSNLSLRRFVRRWLDIMRLWSLYLSIIDILENLSYPSARIVQVVGYMLFHIFGIYMGSRQ